MLATAVVLVQGLALVGFGAWLGVELLVAEPSNRSVATGSTAYFLLLGALVLGLVWALWRRRSWSHGAAVFLQVLALPLAWTMATADNWLLAVPTAALAITGLVALLRPDTRAALGRE